MLGHREVWPPLKVGAADEWPGPYRKGRALGRAGRGALTSLDGLYCRMEGGLHLLKRLGLTRWNTDVAIEPDHLRFR